MYLFRFRFSDTQQQAVLGLSLVPQVMRSLNKDQWRKEAEELAETYQMDLPLPASLDMELVCWEAQWKTWPSEVPSTPQEAYRHADVNFYPNINVLLNLMCTIPVTTCSCERSISGLRRLKSYLRSTISQDQLNGLALMHFHYGLDIDYDAIVNDFARRNPRRMQLINVLDEEPSS